VLQVLGKQLAFFNFIRILSLKLFRFLLIFPGFALIMSACVGAHANIINTPEPQSAATAVATTMPDWFDMEMTDVQTGKTFTMNDYAGKVVLLETMAIWCPNCIVQAAQVRKLHETLGNPEDLISVTLDVDSHEDEAALKEYASSYRFNWHFAVAPLLVERALGNLYSAEYLNPPLSPMLIIDREGNVHQLEYGIKDAATLQKIVEPYLKK
jgi:cytochrome oxidase Cu insertion factor (SCO1/SenC/PrrC family)